MVRIAVIIFPGSAAAADVIFAYRDVLEQDVYTVWHQDEDLKNPDVIVLPGGAAFGDYLRPGALTKGSPVVASLRKGARDGIPIIGIGNGFQILCELEILPGVLLPNLNSQFMNTDTFAIVDGNKSVWTKNIDTDAILRLPMSCYYGRYYADKRTLKDLEEGGYIAFRFSDLEGDVDLKDPFNGSLHSIAGIVNRHHNVLGLIQHPERAVTDFMGGTDGLCILESVLRGDTTTQLSSEEEDLEIEEPDIDPWMDEQDPE